ncbi:efflux RND transporter periplasmic adaptor subunit [Nitrospira lenta]|uniref:Putative Heavy metal efflux system, membrane fusion protein n=1 Tax=Nitrospira lenta TaxID=1436998 RepID=A0A330LB36_9BACT|nr:efflux RND transporter periplasmic adaptor subunit [Nitrospira lenta]SPP66304.1 putative Heavy metal efflux system, membrane fusion protein [Nitrospira lenta]
MNGGMMRRSSPVAPRIAIVLLVAIAQTACQAKQEDAPKTFPPATKASHESGVIELPEGSPTLAQLQTDRIALRPIRTALKAQAGKILANENRLAHLSARVPGSIVAVYANLGDRVKEGDRLLLLDSPAFGAAQLEYRKARITLHVTEQALERAQALLDRGAIGAGEQQRRDADYENARADLHVAEEKLHLLGMTEREIQRLAAKTLPHAEVAQVSLRAPFTGDVIERNATMGEVIDPNKTLFTVADLSTVWVRADFPEQQAGRLKTGLMIELRVSAYPDTMFRGAITYVGAVIDPATRTVTARADVSNPDGRLRPEMFAEVTLMTDEQSVLSVPRGAVQQVGSRTVVFVVRGLRRFESREVTIAQASGDYIQVVAGLTSGDEVVTQGSYALKSELLREQMPSEGAP